MLKHILKSALCAAVVGAPLMVRAEESPALTGDVSLGAFSDYMFRGFRLFNGNSIQPSLNLHYNTDAGNFTAGAWSHLSADNEASSERFTEIDYTLKYEKAFDGFTIALGNIFYAYPSDKTNIPQSNEVFATLALNVPLTPTLTVYHDYRAFDAQYYELGFSHTFDKICGAENATLTPFTSFGFASNADKVYADNGLVQVTTGVSSAITVGSAVVTPVINYTSKVDDLTANQLWFGMSVGTSF